MFETWKYLYKSGSPDDKCIDSQHYATPIPYKVKRSQYAPGAGAYCGSHLAAQLVIFVFNVNFVVIQNISASFSELFTYYVLPSPFASKSEGGGGHDTPSSYGSAAPARSLPWSRVT